MRFWQSRSAETLLEAVILTAGSVIGAYTIQALTTTLYAMHVSSDQVPVYKAIVVVIIVALQSPGFAKWRKSIAQKKAAQMNAGKEAA